MILSGDTYRQGIVCLVVAARSCGELHFEPVRRNSPFLIE
jgi:hypothetical protein